MAAAVAAVGLAWAIAAYAMVARLAAAVERFAPPPPPAPAEDPALVEVPDDLLALAGTHTEQWAVEDTVRAMRERYAELRDWNRVRSAFNIGKMP